MKNNIKKAVLQTIPVMTGYLFIGTAFGIYLQSSGLGFHIALLMSFFIYAGSMQFASIPLMLHPFSLIQTIFLTLSINARHLFYGVSMLKPFESAGKKKGYMIFALTDESYSLLIQHKNNVDLMFWILLLNQMYWIIGTVIGFLFGKIIPFSTEGIEFSMAALFIVIFLEKLEEKRYIPMFIGLICSLLSLWWVGPTSFIIVAMIGILLLLAWRENRL